MFSVAQDAFPRDNSAVGLARYDIKTMIQSSLPRRLPGEPMPHVEDACCAEVHPAPASMYIQLQEIQQPMQARKYGTKDRRPLDPPPVVRLRVLEAMTPRPGLGHMVVHREVTNTMDMSNFVCAADLHATQGPTAVAATPPYGDPLNHPSVPRFTDGYAHWGGFHESMTPAPRVQSTSYQGYDLTSYLIGSKVATASNITLDGEPVVVFAFPDLSVRLEGNFCLEYRLFDLTTLVPIPEIAWPSSECQVSCTGGAFKVYPAKGSPCLSPSTRITKALYDAGIRVIYRAHLRTRRGATAASLSRLE
ncbi:velvet factor-domain-containing protein [Schizophyllum commune]